MSISPEESATNFGCSSNFKAAHTCLEDLGTPPQVQGFEKWVSHFLNRNLGAFFDKDFKTESNNVDVPICISPDCQDGFES